MNQENYFFNEESEQFTFYRVPKVLMTNPRYKDLSAEAKLFYCLLLDRRSLSTVNGWRDGNGHVFIYFTITEAMKYLRCGHDKVGRLFSELEKADLINRRKQGQGKPSVIYLKKFTTDIGRIDIKKSTKPLSAQLNFGSQDIVKADTNNTDINDTDYSDTDLSIYRDGFDKITELVKGNIQYDFLVLRHPAEKERINELVCLMVDTQSTTKDTIRISGNDFPTDDVKSRFMKLDSDHIEYVLETKGLYSMRKRNIRYTICFDCEEAQAFTKNANKCEMSKGAYIRSLIYGTIPREAPPVEYFELIRQLRIFNNNLNQIARQANFQGLLDVPKIRKEVENIRELEKIIHSAFAPDKEG